MRCYKEIVDGYVYTVGTGRGFTEITQAEYNNLLGIITSVPTAPDGYAYRLRADTLEWELVELPPEPEPEPEQEEALTRYANKLTGASDETLAEATETLIKIVREG